MKTKKLLAAAAVAGVLCLPQAALAGSHHYDEYYRTHSDRHYAPEAQKQESPAYHDIFAAERFFAVLVGSKDVYLDRQDLFFSIIEDEMNEEKIADRPKVVCDAALQQKWIEYCNTTLHTGEHILQDDWLVRFAGEQGRPILFIYPTDEATKNERKVVDDGRFVTLYEYSQRFVAILVDGGGINRKLDFTAYGKSKKSADRAIVDAFDEGVDDAAKMIFRRR